MLRLGAVTLLAVLAIPPTARAATPSERCAALTALDLPAASIGLPSSGARVTDAKLISATGDGAALVAEHCRVFGSIRPVDPAAPEIRFSVALPTAWNSNALMLGGGGFNGVIPNVVGQQTVGPIDQPPPVSQGYAVFASDSGHQGSTANAPSPAVDGTFAANDEALANYAGDALKKTRDAASLLIGRYYDRVPTRTYFAGGSNGGREGFAAITRWPQDFDGAIIAYPYWNAVVHAMNFGRAARALAASGAYIGAAKQALLFTSVVAACDGLDGAKDGIISNQGACRFDPATLRCPGGVEGGDACLSDAQIAAVRALEDPVRFNVGLGSGETSFPGWPVLSGADLRGAQQLGTTPPAFPSTATQSLTHAYWDHLLRFGIARDPTVNYLTMDPLNPGPWQQRLAEVSRLIEVPTSDYSAFAARGGKLLIVHGLADAIVTHRSSIVWWQRLTDRMGESAVRQFARFYTVPGYGHGVGGLSTFMATWHSLPVLDAWVEADRLPGPQMVMDSNAATRGRTRPLCEYPTWPKYNGEGDINQAASFMCVAE